MTNTPAIPAASMSRSLGSPVGTRPLLLEPGAVAQLEIPTETQSFETSEQAKVLMALLYGITSNTMSGDVIALATYQARDLCSEIGIDSATVDEVVAKYKMFAQAVRSRNPMTF